MKLTGAAARSRAMARTAPAAYPRCWAAVLRVTGDGETPGMNVHVVRRIGYWAEDPELWRRIVASGGVSPRYRQWVWPDPVAIVAARGAQVADPRVVCYLRSGVPGDPRMGYSWCRFRCGISDAEMGCSEQTDGYWIWPDGLAHYVEAHGVLMPDEVIVTMRANDWMPPRELPHLAGMTWELDNTFWEEWGRVQSEPRVPARRPTKA
jgi:hypothetical protein